MSVLKPLDWIIILIYFGVILGLAWKVMRQKQKTSDEYFLAGRNLGWFIVGASIFASQHRLRAPGRPGRIRRHRRRGHGPLRAARLVPARAGLGHGAVLHALPGLHHARVPGAALLAGRAHGPVAHLAGGLRPDQDRRRHLRRRRRLQRPAARAQLSWASTASGSAPSWSSSSPGSTRSSAGCKAVAYTEALQTFILIIGSALVTFFGLKALGGWGALREIAGSEMFNLWKPLVPGRDRGDLGPGQGDRPDGLVLQRQLSLARHALLRPDHRAVVLVHRPVHRPARPRRPERAPGPPGLDRRGLLQAPARVHLHHPRHDRLRPGQERPERRPSE